MSRISRRISKLLATGLATVLVIVLVPALFTEAADHGDAPAASLDRGAEITDVYLFLDPNDNTKVIIAMGIHGFIPPGENNNFSPFDPNVRYHFEFDTTGDARPEEAIDI